MVTKPARLQTLKIGHARSHPRFLSKELIVFNLMCLCGRLSVGEVELRNRQDNVNPVDCREPTRQTSDASNPVEYPEAGNNSNYVNPAEPLH